MSLHEPFAASNGHRATIFSLMPTADSTSDSASPAPSIDMAVPETHSNNKPQQAPLAFRGVSVPSLNKAVAYFELPGETIVSEVLEELQQRGTTVCRVLFEDTHREILPLDSLLKLDGGQSAYDAYKAMAAQESDSSVQIGLAETNDNTSASSSEDELAQPPRKKRAISHVKPTHGRLIRATRTTRASNLPRTRTATRSRSATQVQSDEDSESQPSRRTGRNLRSVSGRQTRSSMQAPEYVGLVDESDSASPSNSDSDIQLLQSDLVSNSRKRKRGTRGKNRGAGRDIDGLMFEKPRKQPTRISSRATRHQENMQDPGMEDVFRSDSDQDRRPAPKVVSIRENFQQLPLGNRFSARHCETCDTCGKHGGGAFGQLIYCQGCSMSYHKGCLGPRGSREHLVTKVSENDFALQCRRCIGLARKKDLTAPDQGMCQNCREVGRACLPFRERKTTSQEEREREENNGQDPVIEVDRTLIHNEANVLFRCTGCFRGFHYHHLRAKGDEMDIEVDDDRIADRRAREYARDWQCIDCENKPAKIGTLVAWRPVDQDLYIPGLPTQDVNEDDKEYLVKWEKMSYFRATWMPGAWVWGDAAIGTKRAFARKDNGHNLPTMNTEDAIPEEFLRIDIVLDVKFTSIVDTRAEEVDKARIREVDKAYVKYKGLGYEDAVWEKAPGPEDGERWTDFVSAYDDWVMGRYIHCPKAGPLKSRAEKARTTDFTTLEKKKQPTNVVGGELMKYQLDGINWLYYRWHQSANGILADEMGLGKTIQIIAFLATLVQDHNCFPFLVVCPNSTCANWRREFKRWAPSLRVVSYFGTAAARSAAYQYEMYPEGSKDLRCHVVVTSYDAAADENCRKFFKSVSWQALIVDEGQRLKSDQNLLYTALSILKVPFRILLTGTPLQNNARELFNLLQFLDESFDAAALDIEYANLTKDNVPQLHNLIRPFFLRRTKAQVLTFLPPMAQIIIPVSMSTLQNKLYNSILTKNPDLIRAIFDSRSVTKGERANMNNLLMQLRKCLSHPFVYSKEIEERNVTLAVSHRNLVEASAKLQFLELLLPKLRQRGHRVLIFSQFLDLLDIMEDFLDGLEMPHRRLDGTISSLQKQKRIDEFNAPDSPFFAFLLSTRAGGVGINLATADTVIILDPDFNPHQDIQALSRAHRIGQKNKVLCFQLMTRASAEEKIVQIGRKKMALDHVLIERMDDSEEDVVDMESILRYGAAEILEGKLQDIRYDDASIEKLLDRSSIEDTKAGEDNSAESQFSFARVWANDTGSMIDSLGSDGEDERVPDPGLWDRILKERETIAAKEAAARQQVLGRGKRSRQNVDYSAHLEREVQAANVREEKETDSDTDFQPGGDPAEDPDAAEESGAENAEDITIDHSVLREIEPEKPVAAAPTQYPPQPAKSFRRAKIVWPTHIPQDAPLPGDEDEDPAHPVVHCIACSTWHRGGYCPLKLAGPESCNLCGLAHFGVGRSCPHIRSETQLRDMLAALRQSPEPKHLIDLAKKYLTGVKGTIVQGKKIKAERAAQLEQQALQREGAISGIQTLYGTPQPERQNRTINDSQTGIVPLAPSAARPPRVHTASWRPVMTQDSVHSTGMHNVGAPHGRPPPPYGGEEQMNAFRFAPANGTRPA